VIIFFILFLVPLVARQLTWPEGLLVLPNGPSPQADRVEMELARFPCELDYFAWGVAFASVYVGLRPVLEKVRALSLFGYMGAMLLSVTVVLWGYWTHQFGIRANPTRWSVELSHLLPALGAFLLLFFVFNAGCLGSRLLAMAPLRFTGLISYEWFLFHGPVVGWFLSHTGHTNGSIMAYAWRTVVPLVLTFGFSVLVYRYFSLPVLNRIREKSKARRP